MRRTAGKFSIHLKLLFLIFIIAIILLNFTDEIYSNIQNNFNYYLFLIYKCCFDLLSLFGLYFRMVINTQIYLWESGWPSPQHNMASALIRRKGEEHSFSSHSLVRIRQGEVKDSDSCVTLTGAYEDGSNSSQPSADFISLDDNILCSTFLSVNNEEKNSSTSTDSNNNSSSSFSDEQDYLPGLGTQRRFDSPSAEVDNNSTEEAVREAQPSVQLRGEENFSSSSAPAALAPDNSTVQGQILQGERSFQQSSPALNSTVQPSNPNSSETNNLNSTKDESPTLQHTKLTDQTEPTTAQKRVTFNSKSEVLEFKSFEHNLG